MLPTNSRADGAYEWSTKREDTYNNSLPHAQGMGPCVTASSKQLEPTTFGRGNVPSQGVNAHLQYIPDASENITDLVADKRQQVNAFNKVG